jgi:formiminoglutamase
LTHYPYPMLVPPPFSWQKEKKAELKVHEWIQTVEWTDTSPNWSEFDVAILGVPLSRSSISASSASLTPDEMRLAWKSFSTYNLEEDVDLSTLRALDLGNVREHVTDISQTHANIKEAMVAMQTNHPTIFPITLGGDHSITAMLVKGWKEAHPTERIGVLQFDTHFDLRDLTEIGPANGTPMRNLIESETVKGEDIYNIGLHGFFNAKSLKEYADSVGLHYVTLRSARKAGIEKTVTSALNELAAKVDTIYLTVDMDVLDIGVAPGAPASTPGGMYTHELLEAVTIAGKHPKVKAMDIVCLDPVKDVGQATVKTGVHVMLSFLSGFVAR